MRKRAKIYLVGAGPGAKELLTLRACEVLGLAEVVLYDRLVSAEVLSLARPGAVLVNVGKKHGEQEKGQQKILRLLEWYARRRRHVVRLKGGDPLVFGRGAEEWEWLRQRGWEVELVPGVSSAVAVPGLAGIPPTFRQVARSFAVVTGHTCGEAGPDWDKLAGVDTLIILMGVANRERIAHELIAAGRNPRQPVAFIENGTLAGERVVVADLGEVAAGRVEVASPAVMVVGEVVRLQDRLVAQAETAIA
ncbi:MAG: uroporphyrinogen-III C-methyltransferase [Bryobacteraceae bacterium]|nr:uroporphyrinogen-III C-methyltransferase [Bryobacteraceae bacterium]